MRPGLLLAIEPKLVDVVQLAALTTRNFRTPDIAPKSFQYASFSRGGCEPKTVRFLRL